MLIIINEIINQGQAPGQGDEFQAEFGNSDFVDLLLSALDRVLG